MSSRSDWLELVPLALMFLVLAWALWRSGWPISAGALVAAVVLGAGIAAMCEAARR